MADLKILEEEVFPTKKLFFIFCSFLFIISKKGIVLVKNGQIEIALYEDRFQQAYIMVSYGVFFDLGGC
ncbi:MAG: hypothetical protein BAJALOKI2v1_680023, partial [Promethearchaeota archaeon]